MQQDIAIALSMLACFSVELRRSSSITRGAAMATRTVSAPPPFAAALWSSSPAVCGVMLRLIAGRRAAPAAVRALGAAATVPSSAAPSTAEPGILELESVWELSREHEARLWQLDGVFALGARLRAARAPENFVLRAAEACGGVEHSAVRPLHASSPLLALFAAYARPNSSSPNVLLTAVVSAHISLHQLPRLCFAALSRSLPTHASGINQFQCNVMPRCGSRSSFWRPGTAVLIWTRSSRAAPSLAEEMAPTAAAATRARARMPR